ncbi:MAG: hypothetical protein ACR2NX_00325 [Chthoniobacterales bacterium]
MPFDDWLRDIGVARITGYRFRKRGVINNAVNIFGRLYVSREEIADFERRAKSGEFSHETSITKQRRRSAR